MTSLDAPQSLPRETAVELAFAWFQRVIAGYCLLFGILYWIRLIGLYPGTLWRFDLMPVHWQVAGVILAVFLPFAASGLCMLDSWGPEIWFISAFTESVRFLGYPEHFGTLPITPLTHLLVAMLYVAFRVVIRWQKRSRTVG